MPRTLKKTASASRRRAYAKLRKTSKCRTKKAGPCKRSKSCKWAKGKKRTFCRRAKNLRYV